MIADRLCLTIRKAEVGVVAGRAGHIIDCGEDRVKEEQAPQFHFFWSARVFICFIDRREVSLQSAIGRFDTAGAGTPPI